MPPNDPGAQSPERTRERAPAPTASLALSAGLREQATKEMHEALKFPGERIDGRGWGVNLRAANQVAEALGRGADPRAISSATGLDSLMSAAIGYLESLRVLLDGEADPKAQDAGGMTALMYAAGWNCGTAPGNGRGGLEALLAVADANAQDQEGRPALTHSIAWGHEGAAALLASKTDTSLQHAADSEAAPSWGKKGEPALFFAVRTTKAAFIEIVARHSDRSATNEKGFTAWQAAMGLAACVPFGWRGVEAMVCAASTLAEAHERIEEAQECLGGSDDAWAKMPRAREAIARLEAQALREQVQVAVADARAQACADFSRRGAVASGEGHCAEPASAEAAGVRAPSAGAGKASAKRL